MATSKAEGKRRLKEMAEEEEEEEEDEDNSTTGDDEKKKKGKRGASTVVGGSCLPACQVENCTADMTDAKRYHRRHKVCEFHAKAPVVRVAGIHQRFCQQCSRFHELSEFDETKEAVDDVWPDTTSAVGKVHRNIMEKAQIIKTS